MPALAARVAIWALAGVATYFTWQTADTVVRGGGGLLDKPTLQLGAVALVLYGAAAVLEAKHGGRR
jgi:hypothetical protein